jgi:hypothetical protein
MADDLLLPGSGFCTATENVPADAALPAAVSCVAETNVVAIAEPFISTSAPVTNLLPVTVSIYAPVFTDDGEMPLNTGVGLKTVILPDDLTEESAALVAVTFNGFDEGSVAGAVYTPDVLISPSAADPPAVPFTDQVTAVFEFPVTAAVNVRDSPTRKIAAVGATETVTGEFCGGEAGFTGAVVFPDAQPPATRRSVTAAITKKPAPVIARGR